MRKLRPDELAALRVLANRETICLGAVTSEEGQRLSAALASLAKLKLAIAEETDDGPSYSLTSAGRVHSSGAAPLEG